MRRARAAAFSLAVLVAACLASIAGGQSAPGPAPPSPATSGTVSVILLLTGLNNYTAPVATAFKAAVASVASSGLPPGTTNVTASQVALVPTSYAAYAAITLQGACLAA